ncbi:MAG: DUF3619 family protein [Pseudomonadota bacterium]|nr:DUF3619 family protein [Pseudomonadota bacterium]
MNTDDINLAYKVRHALNEQLDTLPDATTTRLAAARKAAMARKKADAPRRAPAQPRFTFGSLFSMSGLGRVAVAVPLFALVAGLAGVYQHEQKQHIADMAELDAAVLSDELPLTAYLDDGFNAYLASQKRTR